MKQPNNTALYMRLSRDDENYGDSVSIETQRTILRNFAIENGFYIVDEYIDDGWSGTNFDRPAFQRMLEDIEAGKINTVCTKDLSRFGREHVKMGYYLEFYFPEKNVRYIAVTDNEDSDKGLSDFVPFKNLFNEWFAKDTSRKVKAAVMAKHAAGERMSTYAPLGYLKDPDKKNSLIVDEEYKWIIEKIFDMAFHGNGTQRITKALIEEKIPTAGYILYKRYGQFAHVYKDAPPEKAYAWTQAVIKSILKDETYIGNTVYNKRSSISYKNKKLVRKPEEEWMRVVNTHEPIIEKAIFDQVQKQIEIRRRSLKSSKEPQMFAGLVKCADCGWSMGFGTNNSNKTPYSYFVCTKYRQFGKLEQGCSIHYVRYDVFYAYVLARIQYWAKQAELGEEELLNKVLKASDRDRAAANKKQAKELKKTERRKVELDRLFAKLYEDRVNNVISDYNFNMLSQKYQTEQAEVEEKLTRLSEELNAEKETAEDAHKWIDLIKEYSNPTELNADLLNTLIEKIVVHEAVTDENGFRSQEIEIYYRFVGKID